MTENKRFVDGVENAHSDDVKKIVGAAIRLQEHLYARNYRNKHYDCSYLFDLRKALERIWGHDIPKLERNKDD